MGFAGRAELITLSKKCLQSPLSQGSRLGGDLFKQTCKQEQAVINTLGLHQKGDAVAAGL